MNAWPEPPLATKTLVRRGWYERSQSPETRSVYLCRRCCRGDVGLSQRRWSCKEEMQGGEQDDGEEEMDAHQQRRVPDHGLEARDGYRRARCAASSAVEAGGISCVA